MRPSGPWGENLAMEIRRVRFSDPEVESLLVGLSDEYDTRYGENIEMTRASEAEFDPPAGLFIVLMDGPTIAAGGGFRRFNESTCEVKRMWTSPLYRRRGLATWVLQSLEEAAWEIGYAYLILETGPRQPEAEALYAGRGYSRIEAYGHYPEAHAFRIDLSCR
jgi:GNAT superfamily N-acetyltransferase